MKARSKFKGAPMTMQDILDYDFGIYPGQIVKVKAEGSVLHGIPPWDGSTYVAKITTEYPFLFSGILYPHKYRDRHNISNQYNVSISKVDIWIGDVKVIT